MEDIHPTASSFITIRLDSDDALSSKTLERILEVNARQEEKEMLLNIPSGIQLDWKTGEMLYRTFRPHYREPFLAIKNMTREKMLNTGKRHLQTRELYQIVDVPGLNWAQVVHGGNIRNQIRKNINLIKIFKQAAEICFGSQLFSSDLSHVPKHLQQAVLADFGIHR